MAEAPAAEHPLRHCDVCRQVDDHPRHVHHADEPIPVDRALIDTVLDLELPSGDRGRIVADISDPMTQTRHMDCCRSVGCPDGTCDSAPALKGQDLRDHIIGSAETPKEG